MAGYILHQSHTRGHANHGWLNTFHTFSFANYFDPERVHFGALRVINDDSIDGGMGFGRHPHDNMEIITIPLEGDLEHKDSMGNSAVIREGDVQVMSAGTGVFHSEYNKNSDRPVKLLQIWVFPDTKSVEPRYDQVSIRDIEQKNAFYQILSPNKDDQGVWIHQNAWFHLGQFDSDITVDYNLNDSRNGVYAFVIEGSIFIDGQELHARDGLGIWATDKIEVRSQTPAKVLLMEVPMMD